MGILERLLGRKGLPETAESKFRELTDQCGRVQAQVRALSQKRHELRDEIRARERRLKEWHQPPSLGGPPRRSKPMEDSVENEIAALSKELSRIETQHRAIDERFRALSTLHSKVEAYVGKYSAVLRECKWEILPWEEVDYRAVRVQRDEIASLKADIHETQSAPRASDEVKAQARREIDELVASGTPDVFGAIEAGLPIKWPRQRLDIFTAATAGGVTARCETPHVLAILMWAHRDDVLRAVEAEIDKRAMDANALPEDVRQKRLIELHERLLAAERNEEALIVAGGNVIDRRPDADPRAFLEVDGPHPT